MYYCTSNFIVGYVLKAQASVLNGKCVEICCSRFRFEGSWVGSDEQRGCVFYAKGDFWVSKKSVFYFYFLNSKLKTNHLSNLSLFTTHIFFLMVSMFDKLVFLPPPNMSGSPSQIFLILTH